MYILVYVLHSVDETLNRKKSRDRCWIWCFGSWLTIQVASGQQDGKMMIAPATRQGRNDEDEILHLDCAG